LRWSVQVVGLYGYDCSAKVAAAGTAWVMISLVSVDLFAGCSPEKLEWQPGSPTTGRG
jgi:hypothetical protein